MSDQQRAVRAAFLSGVEFGFIMGEKGHNLDYAIIEARRALHPDQSASEGSDAAQHQSSNGRNA